VGEASAERKLSTATSILARTYRDSKQDKSPSVPTKFSTRSKADEETSEEEECDDLSGCEDVSGAEAAVSAEERRRRHVRHR